MATLPGQAAHRACLEIKRVKDWIDENLPGEDIPVTGDRVHQCQRRADAEPGEVAVVKADGLAAFMKDGLMSRVLSTSQQRQLRKMLDDAISAS